MDHYIDISGYGFCEYDYTVVVYCCLILSFIV